MSAPEICFWTLSIGRIPSARRSWPGPADDPAMLADVLSLLQAHAKRGDLLDGPLPDSLGIADAGRQVMECPDCGLCFEAAPRSNQPVQCPSHPGATLVKAFSSSAIVDGKYRVECCLGRGGMGAVYRVRQVGLDRLLALKLILSTRYGNDSWRDMFVQEAKALGRLQHPNIVDVTDYGIDPRGMPYLVTELLKGENPRLFMRSARARSNRGGPAITRWRCPSHRRGSRKRPVASRRQAGQRLSGGCS
jgi:Protein kinase domain